VSDTLQADTIPLVLTEIQNGDGLTLSAAGRLLPGHRSNSTTDPSTVFRWITRGSKAGGRVVRLEAARIGAKWYTSRGAITRFSIALTPTADPSVSSAAPNPKTTGAQQRADRAGRALQAKGA
jgi:hypothetical protein